MPLFEVAVIARVDGDERLALPPTPVIAADEKSAIMAASVRASGDLGDVDPADVTVLVRPFIKA